MALPEREATIRTIILSLVAAVLLVVAAWTAAWFYLAHEAGTQLVGWLTAEAKNGRIWTCPDRHIAGYPFAIDVGCTKPTFTGRAPGQTVHAEAAGLSAAVSLAHPTRLSLAVRSPFAYRSSDGDADLAASWSKLTIALDSLTAPSAVDLSSTNLKIDGRFGDSGRQTGDAATLDAHVERGDDPKSSDYTFAISTTGSHMPQLDALLGGAAPLDADLNGRILRADLDGVRTPQEAIEQWRQSVGLIELGASRLSRGDASVSGTGQLGLDEAHRLKGHVDASFVGLEPTLKRYGINADLAAAGSLISDLFGGGKPKAAPGTLNLPLKFQNGFVTIGPFNTQIALTPLY